MIPTFDTGTLRKRIRRHVTGRQHAFFAAVHPGFESLAAEEIRDLGIDPSPRNVPGGVEFSGKLDACYRANIRSRTVTRILLRLAEFRARRFAKLRELAGDVPWELYLAPGTPVAFSTTAHESRLFHTGRIETEFRRAISARLAGAAPPDDGSPGPGPDFDEGGADPNAIHTVFIRLDDDLCTVSLDSTGEPLYKRGRRRDIEDAPLRENLAASLLLEAGIGRCGVLVDPMAGAGTFSMEAGLIALNIPPGLGRSFAFEKWPAYSAPAREHLAKLLGRSIKSADASSLSIICADIDEKAVATAQRNMERAGLGDIIKPRQADFFTEEFAIPARRATLVALNPPYGRRLGNADEALALYRRTGERLRAAYSGAGFVIIAPGRRFEKALGVAYDKRIAFSHGGIPVAALIRLPRA